MDTRKREYDNGVDSHVCGYDQGWVLVQDLELLPDTYVIRELKAPTKVGVGSMSLPAMLRAVT